MKYSSYGIGTTFAISQEMQRLNFKIYIFMFFVLHFQSALACTDNLRPFSDECEIQDRFEQVKSKLNRMGIDHDEITEYRALRFVSRRAWKKVENNPEKSLPWLIYNPAPKTWLFWERGEFAAQDLTVDNFNQEKLQEIHKQALDIDLMSKWAIYFKGAKPGKIRSSFWQIPPAFDLTSADAVTQKQSDLLKNYDIVDTKGSPLFQTKLLPCEDNQNYFCGYVLYVASTNVPRELSRMINEIKEQWKKMLKGQDKNLSPTQFAAKAQRWFVSIHPFGDGNGRISRYIQDAIIRSFDLPYPSAGDLHNDLLTPQEQYSKEMLIATRTSMEILEKCADEIEQFYLNVSPVSPSCQPVSHTLSAFQEAEDLRAQFQIMKSQFINEKK